MHLSACTDTLPAEFSAAGIDQDAGKVSTRGRLRSSALGGFQFDHLLDSGSSKAYAAESCGRVQT